jgi:hypothetical protein
VTLGTKFTLDMMVSSGSTLVNGQQSYLTFTNSIMRVVSASQAGCITVDALNVDTTSFDTALQNEVCNSASPCDFGRIIDPPASISFASGALSRPARSGDFRVARVAFCPVAVGDGSIHWQFNPPAPPERDSQVSDANSANVTNRSLYSDVAVHVSPATVLVGHVTVQGRQAQPSDLQSVPVTLTLKSASSGVSTDYSSSTDINGFFTVTVPATGTYSYRVKNFQTLAYSGNLTVSGSTTNKEMGALAEGDANNDNCINIGDFTMLASSFGTTAGNAGFDVRTDFDGDGSISITDFGMLRNSFGACGANPLRPALPGR